MSAVDQFFELDTVNKCVRFTGDKLEIFIPMRYQTKNYLIIEDKIQALGIFSLRVNGSIDGGLQIPAMIQIDAAETRNETIDGEPYFVCVLNKNNRIMTTTTLVKNDRVIYFMWTEFLSLGRMPKYMTYDSATTLFDDLKEITGKGTGVDHSLIEVILAHVYRDPNDLNIFYRHTGMRQPPAQISLRDVGYGAATTHSRIIGSYADIGRNSALLNQSEQNHTLEDLFRQ